MPSDCSPIPRNRSEFPATVTNFERASVEMAELARTQKHRSQNQQGPGFAHEVVYGQESERVLAQFGSLADEMSSTLQGVRQGNGLAKSLLYGSKGADPMRDDMAAILHDVRTVVATVRAGKGTIGALLVDPSLYEDMKSLVGNVQRNDVLRALVRYSIAGRETASVP
jgi:phospholipid/cholesterol/gamma-HCH transport system substrate-binding protein